MTQSLSAVVNLAAYPLGREEFRADCRRALAENGVLLLQDFLLPAAVASLQKEGAENRHLAYYTTAKHNIYLAAPDESFPATHPRNREVCSSKGCITTDQIPRASALFTLYDAPMFRAFLCAVLEEKALYEYADPLASLNLHYASDGQELGWHFDNSSFAITLMVQKPLGGGVFEYVAAARDADSGDMNYALCEKVLNGEAGARVQTLALEAGALALFRGRNALHRVTPVRGARARMLAVLAYNTAPGIALSESARMTFFGRLK